MRRTNARCASTRLRPKRSGRFYAVLSKNTNELKDWRAGPF